MRLRSIRQVKSIWPMLHMLQKKIHTRHSPVSVWIQSANNQHHPRTIEVKTNETQQVQIRRWDLGWRKKRRGNNSLSRRTSNWQKNPHPCHPHSCPDPPPHCHSHRQQRFWILLNKQKQHLDKTLPLLCARIVHLTFPDIVVYLRISICTTFSCTSLRLSKCIVLLPNVRF